MALPSLRYLTLTTVLLAWGAVGGWLATLAYLPLPWMLGSLIAVAFLIVVFKPKPLRGYKLNNDVRACFVALVGVMIGAQVTPEFMALIPSLSLSVAALVPFVVLCHFGNYTLFRRVGQYDRTTAFYAGTPGGLMESIVMGEAAGADIRILAAQQFLRIIVVITLLPLGLSLWLGEVVGSASGAVTQSAAPVPLTNLLMICATAMIGLLVARFVHLPAAQLTGPLILSGLASAFGLVDLHLPLWLIAVAQVVIGTSLGVRFEGMESALLRRCFALSLASVGFMIALAALFALVLAQATSLDPLLLLVSFAPGGVIEMSVVALSLAANPAVVSAHHIIRILLTVLEIPLFARWLGVVRGD